MSAGAVIASVLFDQFAKAIHSATGAKIEDSEDLKAIARRAAVEAVYGGVKAGMDKLQSELAELGFLVALHELDRVLRDAEEWFTPKGELPNLLEGADVQIMPPDWKPDPEPSEGG